MGALKLTYRSKNSSLKVVHRFFSDEEKSWAGAYKYGFNGMERDDEVSGSGNSYTTEFRQYDPRLGRWKSIDPLFQSFPWQSPYVAFDNNPIYYRDPKGLAAEGGDPEKITKAASNAVETVEDKDAKDNPGQKPAMCNVGVNCAFKEVTGSNELSGKRANEMYDQMNSSGNFEEIDPSEAQETANDGDVVIAAWKNPSGSSGHVAMVVPGEAGKTGTWEGKPARTIGGMPRVMDTGSGLRTKNQTINFSFGRDKQSSVKFFKYKPALSKTNSTEVAQRAVTYGPVNLAPVSIEGKGTPLTKMQPKSFRF